MASQFVDRKAAQISAKTDGLIQLGQASKMGNVLLPFYEVFLKPYFVVR